MPRPLARRSKKREIDPVEAANVRLTVRLARVRGVLINVECVNKWMHGVPMVWTAICQDLRRRFKDKSVPSREIALAALDQIEEFGEAGRLANNIACPIIPAEEVNRFEHMVKIP